MVVSVETKLSELFKFLAEEEQSIDILRAKMVEDANFDAYMTFKFLDKESKNYLSEFNLIDFLKSHTVYISQEEAAALISFYDPFDVKRLTFENFLHLVCPAGDQYGKKNASEASFYSSPARPQYLPYNLEFALAKLLARELDFLQRANSKVREIVYSVDFDFTRLFRAIDVFERMQADTESISIFMNRHGKPLYEQELNALLARIDLNRDRKVDYKDLERVFKAFCDFYAKTKIENIGLPVETTTSRKTRESPFANIDPEVTKKNAPASFYSSRLMFSEREAGMGRFNREGSFFSSKEANFSKYLDISKESGRTSIKGDERTFVAFLEEVLKAEKQLEDVKADLAFRRDFKVIGLYKAFELEERGFISESDLKYSLRELNMNPSMEEVRLLLRRYNPFRSATLDLKSFGEMILPLDKSFSSAMMQDAFESSTIPYKYFDSLLPETKNILTRLFVLMLENERRLEGFKQFLKKLPLFSEKECFDLIDRRERGGFTTEDLVHYCRQNKMFISKGDAELIFNRFDKNQDWRVSYIEFVDEMKPASREYFPFEANL